MNSRCAVCGLEFERENGYFLGAMVLSYFVGAAILIPGLIVLRFGLGLPLEWCIAATVLGTFLLSPFLFRYSRLAWIHGEQFFDPTP
jgi:uncharacterized protein (DUF983 family)